MEGNHFATSSHRTLTLDRLGLLAGGHLQCRLDRFLVPARGVVCWPCQAHPDASGVDLRSGLDFALRHDGHGRLAGVAQVRLGQCHLPPGTVSRSISLKRVLVLPLLRPAASGSGTPGYCRPLAGYPGHSHGLLALPPAGWPLAASLPPLGKLRHISQLPVLAS